MTSENARAIAAVQACRRQVAGYDDEETWRAFLLLTTGKRSLREMTGRELGQVIDALHQRGARRQPKATRISPHPHVRKAFKLWSDMCEKGIPDTPTRDGLAAFVRRQVQVDNPNWLTAEQANKVIEGLKAWRNRVLRQRDGGHG